MSIFDWVDAASGIISDVREAPTREMLEREMAVELESAFMGDTDYAEADFSNAFECAGLLVLAEAD